HQLYQSLQRQGLGLEGNHALVKAIEKMSGVEVGVPREAQD
ncbi:MAG: NAD(P)-dependent oxidoreductase, partial [Deltaproteobacteria bacterium]|nr:NAD(P)-dependent oxidoreductase [Deltaproteobacteria bacterium]